MKLHPSFQRGVFAMCAALLVALLGSWVLGWSYAPLLVAERIMEATPAEWAVPLLQLLGVWAKPWAVAGGVACLVACGGIGGVVRAQFTNRSIAALVPALMLVMWLLMTRAEPMAFIPALLYGLLIFRSRTQREPSPQMSMAMASRREFLQRSLQSALAVGALAALSGLPLAWRTLNDRAARTLFAFQPEPPRSDDFAAIAQLPPEVTPIEQFYVMSKTAQDPDIWRETWQLRIGGHVQRPLALTWSDLFAFSRASQYATLECVSNPVGGALMSNGFWSGVRLRELLGMAQVKAGAQTVVFHARDAFADSIPIESAQMPETLIAYALNGELLNIAHGAPARLIVPDRYGFKNVKWVDAIEVLDVPYQGRWQTLGWSNDALVKTTARIDRLKRYGASWLVVGVAFAGARGISRVQVRADDGAWLDAQLHVPPLSPLTWLQWRVVADFSSAKQVSARAWDGSGRPQIETPASAFPDGASGLHVVEAGD